MMEDMYTRTLPYFLWGGGVLVALFVLTFFWNLWKSRRVQDPVFRIVSIIRAALKSSGWAIRKTSLKTRLAKDGFVLTHKREGQYDRVSIEHADREYLFVYFQGDPSVTEIHGMLLDSEHPNVRCNRAVIIKMLNAVCAKIGIEGFGINEDFTEKYQDELKAKKDKANEHRKEIEERLNPKKRKKE